MFTKYSIEFTITVLTGLHIGDNTGFAPIGAMDNPVIRDAYSGDPYIPGSSIKGKMRSLLAKAHLPEGKYILPECKDDDVCISRLFGSPADKKGNPVPARLQFADAFLSNRSEMMSFGSLTESKSENSISRQTSIANPRPMERVVRGSKFRAILYYCCEKENEMTEDMLTLAKGFKLLNVDYLGGGGSRGNGRIRIDDIKICRIYPDNAQQPDMLKLFEDVKDYAIMDL